MEKPICPNVNLIYLTYIQNRPDEDDGDNGASFKMHQLSRNLNHLRPKDWLEKIISIFAVYFFKLDHFRPLFLYFRLSNSVDRKQMFNKNFADDWIRTADLWYCKLPSTNWATSTVLRHLLKSPNTFRSYAYVPRNMISLNWFIRRIRFRKNAFL